MAIAHYQRAVATFRAFGDRLNEADVLTHLGDTQRACGAPGAARRTWQLAVNIYTELDHPDGPRVLERLSPAPR